MLTPPRNQPLNQSSFLSRKSLRYLHYKAILQFPGMNQEHAFHRMIETQRIAGVFFLDEDGRRCIFRGTTKLERRVGIRIKTEEKQSKVLRMDMGGKGGGYECFTLQHTSQQREAPVLYGPLRFSIPDNLEFLIRKDGKQSLYAIDLDNKEPGVALTLAHPSERSWNLNTSHPRHLLNFPQEILAMILKEVVLDPTHRQLAPDVLTVNSDNIFQFTWPHYKVKSGFFSVNDPRYWDEVNRFAMNKDISTSVTTRCTTSYDDQGSYVILHQVMLPVIDAGCLRTCKLFHNTGNAQLYSNNLIFLKNSYRTSLATDSTNLQLVPDISGSEPFWRIYDAPAVIPSSGVESEYNTEIARGLQDVEQTVPLINLVGWVYHETFLRFLHTIGPRNAKLLKTLTFRGHSGFGVFMVGFSYQDFTKHLRLYAKFMAKFCTGLERVVIEVQNGRVEAVQPSGVISVENEHARRAILPLLKNEFRDIESLVELVVVDETGRELSWGDDAARWFVERNERKAVAVRREKLAKSLKMSFEQELIERE